MSTLVIIPARGGSKGVPRKNVRPLRELPLLGHTILQARGAKEVDRVVVSTDDEEIAGVASAYGAEVIERPAEISSDESASEEALAHALDALETDEGYQPDLVVFLQVTSPLRTSADISRAIATLEEADADSLFSACRLDGFVWRQQGESLIPLTYDFRSRPRRQEIGRDVVENGSIYVFKPWVLRQHGNRLGGRMTFYEMDPLSLFQVDEVGDLDLLERLWSCWELAHADASG